MVGVSTKIHYIIDPEYAETVWCKETLSGISSRASSLRYSLSEHSENTLCEIPKDDSIIVIGTSRKWVSRIILAANELSVKTVAVSCQPFETSGHSDFVLIDHNGATKECLGYLRSAGKVRTALFGINDNGNSYADTIKTRYFPEDDIYYINSEDGVELCFENFFARIDEYDSVVCSNYITAVYLVNQLKKRGIGVPSGLYVMTYGDSVIGKMMTPSLTTITLDHEQLGVQAVNLCRFPCYTPEQNVSVTVCIPCRIIAAESTDNVPYIPGAGYVNEPEIIGCRSRFLEERSREIQSFEKLLRLCDDNDLEMLRLLLAGETYGKISEKLYMSESTVKYRIKRLISGSGVTSVSKMLALYTEYIVK